MRTSPRKRNNDATAEASSSASPPTTNAKRRGAAASAAVAKASKSAAIKEEVDESELDCPSCPPPGSPPHPAGLGAAADRETWVCCSHCKRWYHCICVRLCNPQDYSKWYCADCIAASAAACAVDGRARRLQNIERPPPRKSKRARLEVDYAAIQEGMPADPIGRWTRLLDNADVLPDRFRRMKGEEWTVDWLARDDRALSEPVLVPACRATATEPPQSQDDNKRPPLEPQRTSIPGMVVPPASMTISDVARLMGPDTPVEVIDVASQTSSKAWTLSAWADYCALPKEKRKKVLNVISLEVTSTPMERFVEAPQLVRQLDWVTRDWPASKRGVEAKEHTWPKVQRYVLMGVEGGYSDWHIDFAGSSVYYHVVWGQKTFLFAPPTPANLVAYRTWCSSTRQDFDWLGDHVTGLTRVDIRAGETMLIPSGWLHSVYTPKPTLVVGGNFLTDRSVEMQWKLVEIEHQTKVPRKFRFPHLKKLTWYVAKGWQRRLRHLLPDLVTEPAEEAKAMEPDGAAEPLVAIEPTQRDLAGLDRLLDGLADDIDLLLDDYSHDEKTIKLKKAARDAIPHEIGGVEHAQNLVKDLRSLAAEAHRRFERQSLSPNSSRAKRKSG
ncbi:JmjC domain-containing histone demethylation protein 1 [Thecaphora frezii]